MKELRPIAILVILNSFISNSALYGQNTQIKGFVDALAGIQNDKLSFALGEQDLFITSELSDRFSFLGESVFRFTNTTPTKFSVSIERIVIKYNFSGNHNILVGKHHTPIITGMTLIIMAGCFFLLFFAHFYLMPISYLC